MTNTDRRTARGRVALITAGLAVSGTLGVAGMVGGIALHADTAVASTGTTQTSGSSSGSSSTPSDQGGVSSSSPQSNAQSSGS